MEDTLYEEWKNNLANEIQEMIDNKEITESKANDMTLMEQEDWLDAKQLNSK